MNDPIFKPETWIRYELDTDTAGFGKIVGASFTDGVWNYFVSGTADTLVPIPEAAIKFVLENKNWTSPTHFSGSASAYSNVNAQ